MARQFNTQSLNTFLGSLERRVEFKDSQNAELECFRLIQDLEQASNAVIPSPSLRRQGIQPTWMPGAELWGQMLAIVRDAQHEIQNGDFVSAGAFLLQARAIFEASPHFPR